MLMFPACPVVLESHHPAPFPIKVTPAWGLRCQTIHWSGVLWGMRGRSRGSTHSTAVKGRSSTRSFVGRDPAAPTCPALEDCYRGDNEQVCMCMPQHG